MDRTVLLITAAVVVGLFVYFLPTAVADERRHRERRAIFALNLLLGWTLLGWCVALVWSLTSNVEVSDQASTAQRGWWSSVVEGIAGPGPSLTRTPHKVRASEPREDAGKLQGGGEQILQLQAEIRRLEAVREELLIELQAARAPAPSRGPHTDPEKEWKIHAAARELIRLENERRRAAGLPPLPLQSDAPRKPGPGSDPEQEWKIHAAVDELVRIENQKRAAAGLPPLWDLPDYEATPLKVIDGKQVDGDESGH